MQQGSSDFPEVDTSQLDIPHFSICPSDTLEFGNEPTSTNKTKQLAKKTAMHQLVSDLLCHPVYTDTVFQLHHGIRKSDHLLRTARHAFWIAKLVRADARVCTRAGLLHDVYSRLGTWSTHGAIAAAVARQMGENEMVQSTIISHMYPIGPAPTTKEGWVLVVADKLATASDIMHFIWWILTGQGFRNRRLLRTTDPFIPARAPVRLIRRRHRLR